MRVPPLISTLAMPIVALAFALGLGGCAVNAGGTAMTREQGDAILAELRDIKRVLAEQQQPARAKAADAPRAPATVRVRADGGPSLGSADAPVTLIEYTDFQCPFCRRYHDRTFAEIRKNYVDTGKVRYVVRDLPLSFHEQAEPSAIGARCAAEQGRYWPVRDALFAAQQELSPELVRKTVLAAGADAARYDACVKNPAVAAAVQADAEEAVGAGVDGTPGFIIGRKSGAQIEGMMVSGAQPYSAFASRLDAMLAVAAKPN
jgi:protein-disulfide isomerase